MFPTVHVVMAYLVALVAPVVIFLLVTTLVLGCVSARRRRRFAQ